MKRILAVSTLLASAAILAPSAASADSGFYVGGYGGLNFQNDLDTENQTNGSTTSSDMDTGFVLGAVGGYKYDFNPGADRGFAVRTELDIAYRENGIDSTTVPAGQGGSSLPVGTNNGVSGDVSTFSGLANVWVDYKVGKFTPYIGGGIGLAEVSINDFSNNGTLLVDDSDTVFAYQVGTGVAYALTQSVSLTADYRYFATADAEVSDVGGNTSDVENSSHSVMAGVRYSF